MSDLQPIYDAPAAATCANPNCDTPVPCRGDFCHACELQQRITRQSFRQDMRARKERE